MLFASISGSPLLRRLVEWFWRGDAMRAAQARDDAARAVLFYEQRARIAAEVAQRTLEPSAPWFAGDAEHLAAALYAESIGWSLRLAASLDSSDPPVLKPADPTELAELVKVERERLLRASTDEDTLSRVLESLLERPFENRPLTQHDTRQAARELQTVADRLLADLAVQRAAVERVTLQRATRIGALVLTAAVVLVAVVGVAQWHEERSDLAAGKAWTTSSNGDTSCASPQQQCDNGKTYFFHTQEERNAWVQIDLAKVERLSKVRVLNRVDCCQERASPLVVEVSVDGKSWHEVARNKDTFSEWTARFSPLDGRYVRLKVPRRSILHLKAVRIF
jgi:hypothetical protein